MSLRSHRCQSCFQKKAAAYYQHQSTPQHAIDRTSRHSPQQGKTNKFDAPCMILYSFILVSDAEAEEGEGKPLFGSFCPGAENKRMPFICRSNGCTRKSTNIVNFCVINTGLFFPSMFFQACIDFQRLLTARFPSAQKKRPNQNSSE